MTLKFRWMGRYDITYVFEGIAAIFDWRTSLDNIISTIPTFEDILNEFINFDLMTIATDNKYNIWAGIGDEFADFLGRLRDSTYERPDDIAP